MGFPVPVGVVELHPKCIHRLLCHVQQPLSFNPLRPRLLNVGNVGSLLPLLEPFNVLLPALGRDAVSGDCEFDGINDFGEGSPAKQDDVFMGPTGVANIGRWPCWV